ncbi:flagellar motor protein MotB [Glaciecola petra]|uniref:Flagellar motor protein MotB n=1 Tax=Glaciecola petra TaxID=3075602 RepID=A0ABU2ZTP2_9ALTE|nr:flagellar motor protein MotB [Aestuariibacter sp. P117]MDT0595776.1 flagellar motor protein MotB [Aestuariibacter sp. P117]
MEDECPKCPPEGLPAWMGTFADLMSLLMCFFVLLLSFSEMDVKKFKQIAGSMKFAFGVQNKIELKDIPKGTSVVALEFRPGKPDPTPIETVQQVTQDITKPMLNFQEGEDDSAGGRQKQQGSFRGGQSPQTANQTAAAAAAAANQEQIEENKKKIEELLQKEIKDGAVDVENLGQQIIIRVRENGSFSAGSAFLQPQFVPLIRKLGEILNDMPGKVEITGHSDNVQVSNELYRSNWDLSAQRAVAVAEELRRARGFDETRMRVIGKAATQPMTEEDTAAARAKNRRVEIAILQGEAKFSDPISVLEP